MAEPIYRTVFLVEVFSRGPLDLSDTPESMSDLAAIDYEITDGSCIGNVQETESDVVPPEDLLGHLARIGNDGDFFNDDDFEAVADGPGDT